MSNLEQPPVEAPEFGMMERLSNSRLGMRLTAGLAALALGASTEATALAFNADPVTADNVPARLSSPEASASAAYRCASKDSQVPHSDWRATYGFRTPNGKEPVHTVKPQGLVRFVARVAGGNVDVFDLEVPIVYYLHSDLQVLKRGSHPAWYRSGGDPVWPVKGLCHWQDKRNISFLVQLGNRTRAGQRVCLPFDVWGRTGGQVYPESPKVQYRCLNVKK